MNDLNASSPGPDGISAKLLKSARLELSATLAKLFNDLPQYRLRFEKVAHHIDHSHRQSRPYRDYRPISLTSNMWKVFEKVLF